nr:PREDICTED: uncharacterized protein LOC106704172 [Latimeria chalumnae]|eukprot:XP_014346063.1 PREDICTED: uncharacterized protein LOC106704172 [Latimeria chalumnae]
MEAKANTAPKQNKKGKKKKNNQSDCGKTVYSDVSSTADLRDNVMHINVPSLSNIKQGGFTARRRRKSSFSVTMLSTRSNDLKNIASSLYEDEKKEDELHLIGTLADMPADERTKALRQLVMNLQEKREFR